MLAAVAFGLVDRLDFSRSVAGVPFRDYIAEWQEIVLALCGIDVVADGD